jgi:DNA recombination protein RmuC
MNEILLYALLLLATVAVILHLISFFKVRNPQNGIIQALQQLNERTERELREQIQNTAQGTRQELSGSLSQFQQVVTAQMTGTATLQNSHITAFSAHLEQMGKSNAEQLEKMRHDLGQQALTAREEQSASIKHFSDTLQQTLNFLSESNTRRMAEIRTTLEEKIRELQSENAKKLEEMRQTVDEKLHATLEQRLGESFKLVSERLEKVHAGLGEMQKLALGVGDLKRVLTNVKTRGTWGEVQLEMLLQQIMTPDQYEKNIATVPGSDSRVEFAIRLPGRDDDLPVWLPIDAKFPKEQYERLTLAAENADAEGVAAAGRELERTLRQEARTIAEKYLSPPLTTDFALLFLPTEGLYAEVMRRPGLSDEIQRNYRVSIAGPSTLAALLNSLQMGFCTLALEKRSSEVWQILGAVKTEFAKFGDALSATKRTLERAARNIEDAEKRTRQMSRKLRKVEALPSGQAQQLLETEDFSDLEND